MESARLQSNTAAAYAKDCMAHEVSGQVYKLFWHGIPQTDIHFATTPDVLHRLHQGFFKHLLSWCQLAITEQELDHHMQCLPPAFGVCHFKNGVSKLSQVTGPERKQIEKILLPCLVSAMTSQGL